MYDDAKYSVGDQLSLVDLRGKVYRVNIDAVNNYKVASQLMNIDILAQGYAPPNDIVDHEKTLFYVCSSIQGDSPEFMNVILWDQILDHSKTVHLQRKVIYRLDIIALQGRAGKPVEQMSSIIRRLQERCKIDFPEIIIDWTDITNVSENELEMMRSAVDVAFGFFGEIKQLESIRPLIQDLKSIDFKNLTSETMNYLASIQSRLALIDQGGASIASTGVM